MRLLSAGNHPESISVPLHCSTVTLVFTLMLEALLLLREYCPILLSCPHMEHCSGLTLNRDFCLAEFTDSVVMFQEPIQWPSPLVTSLSLKDPVWCWGATTHLLFNQISSSRCTTLTKDSSFSWSTCLETILFQASKILRLNLGWVRSPSTWGKYQLIGKTRPSTSVLWVTQCLGLQEELSTNFLDTVAQSLLYWGSWHVLWRQIVQTVQNPGSIWFPWAS